MIRHIDCLYPVDGALLGFLQFGVQLELKMVVIVYMVWFALDVTSRFSFFKATPNDDPVWFVLGAVVVYDETYFLSYFVSITTTCFIDAFMCIEPSMFAFRHSPTTSNINLRLFPYNNVTPSRRVPRQPGRLLVLVR